MKRIIGIAACSVLCLTCFAVAAADIEIQGSLFVPIAYISDRGKIMDKSHVTLGRIDANGIVYNIDNQHLGFIEKDLTVRDVHYKTLATINEDGVITDGNGAVIGAVSDTKISDPAGRPLVRYEAPDDKRGILAYFFFFFFFSEGFGN